MITFEQLRDIIIENETRVIHNLHVDEIASEIIEDMITELNDATDMDDIIAYYCNTGFQLEEAYENILKVLMAKSTIISSLNK